MRPLSERARLLLVLGLLTALATGLRLITWPLMGFWGDEAWSIMWAAEPVGTIMSRLAVGLTMHLYLLLLKGWGMLVGCSPHAWKLPSLVAGIAAVPLLYILVQRRAGSRVALLASLLMACSLQLIVFSRIARVYAVLTDVALLSLWLHLRAGEKPGWRYPAALCLVNSIALMLSLNAAYLLLVQGLSAVLDAIRSGRRGLRPLAINLLGLALSVAAAAVFYAGLLGQIVPMGKPYSGGSRHGLGELIEVFQLLHPLASAPFGLLLLLGGVIAWRSQTRAGRLVVLWAVLPMLLYCNLGARVPSFALARFLVPSLPGQLILVALGACGLADRIRRSNSAGLALAVLLSPMLLDTAIHPGKLQPFYQEPTPSHVAALRLRDIAVAKDLVIGDPYHAQWVLFPYLRARHPALSELTGEFAMTGGERLILLVRARPPADSTWARSFSVETFGGSRYQKALVLLVSSPLADRSALHAALECYLRGAITGLEQAPPGPVPFRRLQELAGKHDLLAQLLSQQGIAPEAERNRKIAADYRALSVPASADAF